MPGLDPTAYHLTAGERLHETASRAWHRLLGAWTTFRAATAALAFEGKQYPISHVWHHSPIHLVGCRVDLDRRTAGVAGAAQTSPHSLLQELLNRSDIHLWGFVSNGLLLRILRDNVSLTRQAFVEFDIESMMEGEVYADFVLLWLLCRQSRVEAEQPEACWLERWAQAAQEEGTRALDRLRQGVEHAITVLGRGFLKYSGNWELRAWLRSGQLSTQGYYHQLLRFVYRLLFLFVAEDRGLLLDPQAEAEAHERYRHFYSTARLRYLSTRYRGTQHVDLYRALRLVMEKLGSDHGCPELALPALGSFLWSAQAMPELAACDLANHALLEAIRTLAFTREGSMLRSVDYKNLGSEELGSVYESLLELHHELNVEAPTFVLATASGHERKTTGSYYTPSSLVQCLLDSALEPVLNEAARQPDAASAILALKVCDPACGSGHFLIAAAHRLAKRLASALRKRHKAERQGQMNLIIGAGAATDSLTDAVTSLDAMDNASIVSLRHKEKLYGQLAKSPTYRHIKLIADAWCAAFVWKKVQGAPEPVKHEVFCRLLTEPEHVPEATRAEIARSANQYQFLHWHVAFPDVFRLPADSEEPENEQTGWSGGFDVVLGNPPWELVAADQGQVPDDDLPRVQFLLRSNEYEVLSGRRDLYKLFLVRGRELIQPNGWFSILTPLGMYVEDDSSQFRQSLFNDGSVTELQHYQNSKKVFFPHVHASTTVVDHLLSWFHPYLFWEGATMEMIPDPRTSPADLTVDTVRAWLLELTEVERRIGPRFARWDVRRRVGAYLRGLLSPVERKNGWQIAEVNGDDTPYGVQHLLGRAVWDAEAVRDDLRGYVREHLGTRQGVVVIDETGFLKKGRHSAGVARQYSGTAGRVENCQIGVFLAYASARGQALLDRDLYLPKEWTSDRERCSLAGIPPERSFATKPALARRMLEQACQAGVSASWVTGDSVYGDDRRLRMWLEEHAQAYVLAVSGKEYVWRGWRQRQVKTVLATLPVEGWTRHSAGAGAKGPRWYDWCWLPLAAPMQPTWRRWLLVRRSLSDPTALRAFVVFAPQATTLAEAVQTAGTRWTIESGFEAAKGEVGLDHYEVRSWTGWYRHVTLAMWAYALLAVVRARHLQELPRPKKMLGQATPNSLAAFKAARSRGFH